MLIIFKDQRIKKDKFVYPLFTVRKLFLNDQLRCGQFTPAKCGQINRRMQYSRLL